MILPSKEEQREWLTNQLEALKQANLSAWLQLREQEVDLEGEKDEDNRDKLERGIKANKKIIEIHDKRIELVEGMLKELWSSAVYQAEG